MGIKDLSKYIRDNTNAYTETHLSHFYGKKIAIDISVFLYKSIRSGGEDTWMIAIVSMLISLKKHGIKIVCVFDGPNAPPEKLKERAERKKSAQKVNEKVNEVKQLLEELSQVSLEVPVQLRHRVREVCKKQRDSAKYEATDFRNPQQCINTLKILEKKFAKQCLPITKEHSEEVKEIVRHMGMAVMQADGEAETLCAYLCIKKMVDGVLTEDTDVLAYGTPLFLSKFDSRKDTVMAIEYTDLIEQFGMTPNQFKDFCIMCGCDYNYRIKLPQKSGKKQTGIGPSKAFNLLMDHGSIENIDYMTELDTSPLNYQRCRVLFTIPKMYDDLVLPYDKPIDSPKIEKFLVKHKCKFLLKDIEKIWAPTPLSFVSDNDDSEDEENDESVYEIYCDGSCLNNPGAGGWASSVVYRGKETILKGSAENTTNNRMELKAAIKALQFVKDDDQSKDVVVNTDSEYVKNGITLWVKKWKQNNWKTATKNDVANADMWKRLDDLNSNLNVEWRWVKAHDGNECNEKVDKLARSEARSINRNL